MKYVIIRDDDTNAFTPIEYLEKLYRPFLEKNMAINLAVIPNVNTEICLPDRSPEYYLLTKPASAKGCVPIGANAELIRYLKMEQRYCLAQHGYQHDTREFESSNRPDVVRRLEEGLRLFQEAGLARPRAFIAPQDTLSRVAIQEAARRFSLISTNWFQRSRLPYLWWPKYILKKLTMQPHWKIGDTYLLSKPGTYLSCFNPYDSMLDKLKKTIEERTLTVLTTHWWEFFRDNKPDEALIGVLHAMCDYLLSRPDIKAVSFNDIIEGRGEI